MSSVGLALVTPNSISQKFAQEQPPNLVPPNPSVYAFGGDPAPNFLPSDLPQDTVTISNALLPATAAQNQSTNAFLRDARSAPQTSSAGAGRNDLSNSKSSSNPRAVASAQVTSDGTPTASQTKVVPASSVTEQEELQQLDRTLQQLGINSQTVSLIRRVELLRLANDPAALEQYFQSSTPSSALPNPVPSATANLPSQPQASASNSSGSTYALATIRSPKSPAPGLYLNVSA